MIFSSIFNQLAAKQVALNVGDAAGSSTPPDVLANLTEAVKLTILGVPDQAATVPSISSSTYARCVDAARLGYAYGFRITWLTSIPFGVIALLCAIAVRDPSKYFTNHVEIHLEKEIGGRKRYMTESKKEGHVEEAHSSEL